MELDSSENSNWLLDYGIPDFSPPASGFSWPSQSALNAPSNLRFELFRLVSEKVNEKYKVLKIVGGIS